MDVDTFLTTVFVLVDEFCKGLEPPRRPGPPAALDRAELLTLALFAQWQGFGSERGFYRYAQVHLRPAFPRLPARSQYNRQLRAEQATLNACAVALGAQLGAAAYEAVDTTAVVTRAAKRRGRGWLAGLADIGWSNRLGWYEGLHLLLAVTPGGAIRGYGVGPASVQDHCLAETFWALRAQPTPPLPSVGVAASGVYVADRGFAGRRVQARWRGAYGAEVVSLPQYPEPPWPRRWRRALAALRQIVETVHARLLYDFGLARERPHTLSGFLARLGAKAGLHNVCIWLNQQHQRPNLAFADLIAW
jgi:hypothetical protein